MKLAPDSNSVIDLALNASGSLAIENTLQTAVIISLLTDRRADPDDTLPDGSTSTGLVPPDRRGWCGDALAQVPGDRVGSRLWLLAREKQTEEVRLRAIDYIQEALQWLIDDGDVVSIGIEAEWQAMGYLAVSAVMELPTGSRFTVTVPTPLLQSTGV